MTGYQETLTDPSYHRQVVVQTAPHIGNTGVNDEDRESRRIWVAGYVVRDPARRPSNWRSTRSLDDELAEQGIVGISGIDTRALTRHLRERGAMRCGVSSVETDADALLRAGAGVPADGRQRPVGGGDDRRAVHRRRDRRAPVHRRRPGLRHQDDDPAPHGRARHHLARAAVDDERRRGAGDRRRRGVPRQRSRRPGHRRRRRRDGARAAAPRGAGVRHLLRQPDPRPRARLRHLQAGLRPPRHQPAGTGPRHRQGRDHRAQPRLRGRRAARPARRRPTSGRSRSATCA